MNEAYVSPIVGMLGVVVGALLTPVLSSRVTARAEAKLAARLAIDGLEDWLKGIEIASAASSRLPHEDFDVYLALELKAFRKSLTCQWWEENRVALLRRASDEESRALTAAGRACGYVMSRFTFLGNAGEEAMSKLARARTTRTQMGGGVTRTGAPDLGAQPSVPDDLSASEQQLSSTEHHPLADEADRESEKHAWDLEMEEAERQLAEVGAIQDHRIDLTRQTWEMFVGTREIFLGAVEVCRLIEEANSAPFGVVSWTRRRLQRRQPGASPRSV